MQPLVTIIVPIYNVEQYLDQCVQSILMQTYPHLEIILVDDGSPDNCPAICDNYAAQDKRIHVIHKTNGGLSSARKVGIQYASGDYVMIVDSDDWIEKNTVEDCLNAASQYNADCISTGYFREYSNSSIPTLLYEKDTFFTNNTGINDVVQRLIGPIGSELHHPSNLDSLSPVCMKLYRIDLIKCGKIVSERIVGSSEDTIFNIYALAHSRQLVYISKCHYHYRKRSGQSISSNYRRNLVDKWDLLYKLIQEFIRQELNDGPVYLEALNNRICCGMIGLGLNEMSNPGGLISQISTLHAILNRPLYRDAFRNLNLQNCPLHWKVFFLLCKLKAAMPLTLLLHIIKHLKSHLLTRFLR